MNVEKVRFSNPYEETSFFGEHDSYGQVDGKAIRFANQDLTTICDWRSG